MFPGGATVIGGEDKMLLVGWSCVLGSLGLLFQVEDSRGGV